MLEYFLQTLLEPIDVVVYQVLSVDFSLVDEANQRQALVYFTQI